MLATAAHHITRFYCAFARTITMVVVALALLCNLVGGGYSGIVHAHEHKQEHTHAKADHHHGDDEVDDVADGGSGAVMLGANAGIPNQTHDHPAELVLCLVTPISCTLRGVHRTHNPSRLPAVVAHDFGPSERPPRLV